MLRLLLSFSFCFLLVHDLIAQDLAGLEFRSIGPYRGGRSAAVTGVEGQPQMAFFGGTGGGVWKTTDGGGSWHNISDGYFGGSIGAVAVSTWDPNVMYVGGGEKTVRGNVSHGYGVFKSVDGGETWAPAGLADSRHIARIRIHPRDPNTAYAAIMGSLYKPTSTRGVYRTTNGGTTWEQVLFANEDAGAVDLVMHPANPRTLYASTWRIRRTPYSLESGGAGSGLWKSTDGGDSWTEITHRAGLPQGDVGIIGVSVSPANPNRVFAIVEANDGGVFRSDDAGETWRKVNDERKLRQRAWYYTRLYADPNDEDLLYVLNVRFWRSKDGGKTYESISTPHGDHHDLWINPDDSNHLVIGDDGGAQVSFDGGETWTTYHNQPTAQFYRVTTDNHFPYRIYGAQQDNSTVRIAHRTNGSQITEDDWEPTAGGESGHIAPHPDNPEVVYGGSYGGYLTRVNHETGEVRAVTVWPDNPMGHGAEGMNPRFQWNFPIFFSPHRDAETGDYPLYAAGNKLFVTKNEGQTWTAISPDLSRNDPSTLGPSGGPITKDNTGVEYYGTIFAAAESPIEAGTIWAGTDDGRLHITRDGGDSWTDITPPRAIFPEWMQVNSIELHPTEAGGLYVAGTRYKLGDFAPYLYKTTDYGATWTKITDGIDGEHFTRVVRADPGRAGLLYAGTESGLYMSVDDGANWQSMQLNLPIVPVTDLAVKEHDLIVATQGRSFWVLDDLTPLHQMTEADTAPMLFAPRPTHRLRGRQASNPSGAGKNAPAGLLLTYRLPATPDSSATTLRVLESDGTVIKSFRATDQSSALPLKPGLNRFTWNLRYPDAEGFDGIVLWAGGLQGPRAAPGAYTARLIVGKDSMDVPVDLRRDPRSSSSDADLAAQFEFLQSINAKLTETHEAVKRIRSAREQINAFVNRIPEGHAGRDTLKTHAAMITDSLTVIEETLYQTKNRSRQDPLNFPIRLNNKLSALVSVASTGDYRPTDQAIAVRDEMIGRIDAQLDALAGLMATEVPAFNALARSYEVPAVIVAGR